MKKKEITDTENKIFEALVMVGVPCNILGFRYAEFAIKAAIEDPELIDKVTKKLYPIVAAAYNTTPTRVERAIRHGVEVAWNRNDVDVIHKVFGSTVSFEKSKPTNSEFISMLAERIRRGYLP